MLTFATIYDIFNCHITNSYIEIYLTFSLNMCHVVNYTLVSLCNIVMMEDDWELAISWCQMGYFKNLCLGSMISLRNGSVLGTSIYVS